MKKSRLSKFIRFLRTWNELINLPLAILIFVFSISLFRWIDPTAGTFDIGVLQVIFIGIVKVLAASGVSYLLLKFNFPTLFSVLTEDQGQDVPSYNHPIWLKALGVYALYFICFLLAMALF